MYRCRRFFAIFLSLAVIASFFSFNSSAEELDDVQATLKMYYNYTLNGVSKTAYNLIPNQPYPLIISANDGDTFTYEINRLYFLDNNTMNSRYFISLKCGFFETHNTTGSADQNFLYSSGFQNITNSTNFVFRNYPNLYYKEDFMPGKAIFWNGPGYWFYGSGNWKPSFDINKSVTFTYNQGTYPGQHILWIVFYDVKVIADYNWLWYQLNTYLNAFQGYFVNLIQNTYDMLNRLTGQATWTVTRDEYDSDGNFIAGTEVQVTWYDAIYQLLTNLYNPVKEQSEQEQRAREAGALDALDDAYDKADDKLSFWSFLDLIDIGDIGEYDDDALGDAGSDSIIDWFSNATKNDIEGQVINPLTRDPEDEVIDFYGQNIEQIQSYFGGG